MGEGEGGPGRVTLSMLCATGAFLRFHIFFRVEDMIYPCSKYYREKVRLLFHFDSMSQVYSVSSNVSGDPLACKYRQDVKICIFTVTRGIYPCSKAQFGLLYIRLVWFVFSARTVFFSHNNSARTVFLASFSQVSDQRTRPKYYHVIVYGAKIAAASKQAHRIAELYRASSSL